MMLYESHSPSSVSPPSPAHQASDDVVREPQLLQRLGHRVQILDLLDQVAAEGEDTQVLHARQAADLLNGIGGQSQVPEWE